MDKKLKLFLIIMFISIFYIMILSYFYIDYSNSLKNFNLNTFENLNAFQNVINKINNENSLLYRSLISSKFEIPKIEGNLISSSSLNSSTLILTDLLNLRNTDEINSKTIVSTINEYYSLKQLNDRIIELHKLNLENNDASLNLEISNLLKDYEIQFNSILINLNDNIEELKLNSKLEEEKLLFNFLIKEIIIFFFYIFSIGLISYFLTMENNFLKEDLNYVEKNPILDEDMRRIVSYIKKEVALGHFPTIKELKYYLKISHPTLILKLNKLEKNNMLSIRKEGRNKHLFLK